MKFLPCSVSSKYLNISAHCSRVRGLGFGMIDMKAFEPTGSCASI